MKKITHYWYCVILVTILVSHAFALQKTGLDKPSPPISIVVVHGSYEQMGQQYGQRLQHQLKQALVILKKFYITDHGIPYTKLQQQAELFYQRFPPNYQHFIVGVSRGAGIAVNDAKILNAMETLGELINQDLNKCAFISIPANKTTTHAMLIGRNYDFPPPFDQLSKFITVTVLQAENAVPTAFISLVGEIYCPTCVNANGLFVELNNGMPSGGYAVNKKRESLLIQLLQITQHSKNMQQLQKQLSATQSDYSLIINTADKHTVKSYEFSSKAGMKPIFPTANSVFASTNFYLNPTWKNMPKTTDQSTWFGVTRRNNLLNLVSQSEQFNITNFKALMDKKINQGGAVWEQTIYQIIFSPKDLTLYIKINNQGETWHKIALSPLFYTHSSRH